MNNYFFDDSLSFLASNYPDYFKIEQVDMRMNDHKLISYLKLIFPDIVDLTHTKSKHDFLLPERKDGGEIKVRRRDYEDTYGIDQSKYNYLMDNNFSYYVVWSPGKRTLKDIKTGNYNPRLYMWNLRQVEEPEWLLRLSPTSTDYSYAYHEQEKDKYHGKLNISEALDLSYLLYH